jgi:hypothetical protein
MQNPKVINLTMTNANTEYSVVLKNVRSFTVKNRSANDVKIAFSPGESGTTYFTLPSGSSYSENYIKEGLTNGNLTLYVQCAAAGNVLEIIYWQN